MDAGLYLFFAFLFLFLSVICVGLFCIKQSLDLLRIELKFTLNESVKTNKLIAEFFNLYK